MTTDETTTDDRVSDARTTDGYGPQVLTALAIGAVLVLVGLLGFVLVPEEGLLLGIFGVNALHNAVHVLSGAVGLVAGYAAGGAYADEYNVSFGVVYLLLGIAWVAIPGLLAAWLNVNFADTLLHLGLGVVLAGVGFGVAYLR